MIDQDARARIKEAVNDYLSDRITAFEFDERLFGIDTKDATARFVVGLLWHTYDDCKDHHVHLDKEAWDTVQRLLLLLESNAETDLRLQWHWHLSQLFACVALVAIVSVCWANWHLWPIPVLLGGLLSMALSSWRWRVKASLEDDPWHAWPFQSLEVLRRSLKATTGFRKHRYPPGIAGRRIRPTSVERAMNLQFRFAWCALSPGALLFQCLPLKLTRVTVSVPGVVHAQVA